ncbi:MAG: hypothetical protein CVU68_00495 [Deltaproteobacteria bacterium HGW-Deltaproteobacteria-3]|nr:MAG: hypothetical protein CVU68_00495 [Deltaproteobacteria bacterium HGW-Deltaproteobacteria-3]
MLCRHKGDIDAKVPQEDNFFFSTGEQFDDLDGQAKFRMNPDTIRCFRIGRGEPGKWNLPGLRQNN